ncbi:MAG: hypothetical protein RQ966_05935 [Acetobacteraceae bacterium]|nr:hypothetical protein [Acetobacteraceae bacterium]
MCGAGDPGFAATVDRSCDVAAAKAEHDWNLPSGILSAVGTVESGRAGPSGNAPWPWTINAAGRGTFHGTKEEAVATVLAIMTRGYPYIDVGCFQVDLAYHPGVFRSLDEAFDPDHNAQAAARILLTQRIGSPDWGTAVARYHSATPALGNAYLERVRRALPGARQRTLEAQSEVPAPTFDETTAPAGKAKLPVVIYARPYTGGPAGPQIVHVSAHRER